MATERQGLLLLGAPLGHPDFVAAQFQRTSKEHEQFLSRIPSLPDVQAAWILLVHFANRAAVWWGRGFASWRGQPTRPV